MPSNRPRAREAVGGSEMNQPIYETSILDLITINGRISKKLFVKVVLPQINEINNLQQIIKSLEAEIGIYKANERLLKQRIGELEEAMKEIEKMDSDNE